MLVPMSARADSTSTVSSPPSVSIELPPSADVSPDGWAKPRLIAQLIPQGPRVIMYRFGAAISVQSGLLSWEYVGVARADIFPEALCGGSLAGKQGGVILLTPSKTLDPAVANAMAAHTADVKRCEIYGGTNAISAGVFDEIRTIFH